MKKITKFALPLIAFLCSGSLQASDTKESLYDSLVAAGGAQAARNIAESIATAFSPRDFESPVHRIKVGEKLYAAKLFKKAALWMLSGVIDKDCMDSVTISSISNDLEEKDLNLEDLKREPARIDGFKDALGEYWKRLDDELGVKTSSLAKSRVQSHESSGPKVDGPSVSHGVAVTSY